LRERPCILVVDDLEDNRQILHQRLTAHGYDTVEAADGEAALAAAREHLPDLILLDVMMPRLDGLEVCRRLAADATLPFMPVILLTSRSDTKDVVAGLDAGAHEYLGKPFDHLALIARVRALLRTKALHDQVQEQAVRLSAQANELAAWNHELEQRVAEQVQEIERIGRLRRFFSPQLADAIARGDERILAAHRSDVTVVFGDLRGFTALAETGEPEDTIRLLGEYHAALGPIVHRFEGTTERFLGDGFLILFNDPVPCPNPAERAIRMADAMRTRMRELAEEWRQTGVDFGFSIGIAQGYATLGRIGYEGRYEYSVVGTVANLGARLCAAAQPWQIVISPRLVNEAARIGELEWLGELALKGFSRPVVGHNVVRLKDL
jgi:adenylate cyclase